VRRFLTTFEIICADEPDGNYLRVEEITADIFAKDEEDARSILLTWLPPGGPRFIAKNAKLEDVSRTTKRAGIFFHFPRKILYEGPYSKIKKEYK